MNAKEVKQWQEDQALERYQLIAPLLDETLDRAKKLTLRNSWQNSIWCLQEAFTAMSTLIKPMGFKALSRKGVRCATR